MNMEERLELFAKLAAARAFAVKLAGEKGAADQRDEATELWTGPGWTLPYGDIIQHAVLGALIGALGSSAADIIKGRREGGGRALTSALLGGLGLGALPLVKSLWKYDPHAMYGPKDPSFALTEYPYLRYRDRSLLNKIHAAREGYRDYLKKVRDANLYWWKFPLVMKLLKGLTQPVPELPEK